MLRFDFLTIFFAGIMLCVLLTGCSSKGDKTTVTRKAPQWRLGMQAYTFNRFTLFETIEKAEALGLKYIEVYSNQKLSPAQPDIIFNHESSEELLGQVKSKLNDAGVTVACYGVVRLGMDESTNREIFDFAKKMGIETITSEPDPKCFKLLDKLTAEYGINVAVHNHPKRPDKPAYIHWNPDEVLKMIEGCNPRVGVCADTGHWARSGIKPVEALAKLEGRIISLHLKDLNEASPDGHDVPWGTGVCDLKGMLAELYRQGFSGVFSIEYEHNWDNSMPEIAECIKNFNQVAQELGVPKSTR